jgi:hypothetical protein
VTRAQRFAIRSSIAYILLAGCSGSLDKSANGVNGSDAGDNTPNGGAGRSSGNGAAASSGSGTGAKSGTGTGSGSTSGSGSGGHSGSSSSGTMNNGGGGGGGGGNSATDAGHVDNMSDAGTQGGSGGSSALVGKAGNPDGKCSQPLPDQAKPADSSHPTTVVGTGTAVSCTADALSAAITQGGVITFNCGDAATITVKSTLELPTDRDTVIDGGNKVTLDGGGKVRIMDWNHGNWVTNDHSLTLQHVVLQNGKASGTMMLPPASGTCSQGYTDGQGGALLVRDGALRAIDVTFLNNHAAEIGPDTGGGAVYLMGSKPAYIASCTFKGNSASNAGAIGSLFATDFIYDSLFEDNEATGHGGNDIDTTMKMCMVMNKNGYQTGSGGNGGAIYNDGASASGMTMNMTICGTEIRNNKSGAFGAGIFFTSNDGTGTLSIQDTTMYNNVPANTAWQWKPGISTNAKTSDPINSDIKP